VVAVDGRSGSGKTTFSELLTRALASSGPGPPQVVHLDDLYPGWDGLARTPALIRRQLLEPLATGSAPGFTRWDWAAGRPGAWRPVPAGDLLLVEGVGSGALACAPYLSVLIWLEAPPHERRRYALARDGHGYAAHWDRWARQEDLYITREDPAGRADLRFRFLPG
jgi:energy-coupling factor transporter ATP-binding protein EcfA2